MKKYITNKNNLLVFAIAVAILVNIYQLPFIIEGAPKNWRSIDRNKSGDIIEIALDKDTDSLTKTHNLYMVLGKYIPNSTLFISEKLDAESESKIYGLGKISKIETRNINHVNLLQKINHGLIPTYTGAMWTSPGHIKSKAIGIKWKIYLNTANAKELLFIKDVENNDWFIVDKVLFTKKELKDICDDC